MDLRPSRFYRRAALVAAGAVTLALLRSPLPAYAHFPTSDGSLTAILHVEPDDYPTAGQSEDLYLIFNDSAHQFRLADCACSLSVSHDGTTLLSSLLRSPRNQNTVYDTAAVPFTFTQAGTYRINLTGQPLTGAKFKPVNINWQINVAASDAAKKGDPITSILKYSAVILGVLIVLGVIVFRPF